MLFWVVVKALSLADLSVDRAPFDMRQISGAARHSGLVRLVGFGLFTRDNGPDCLPADWGPASAI